MEQSSIAIPAQGIVGSMGAEALRELTEHAARRQAGELAPSLAARAIHVTRVADFAVARDALEALSSCG